MKTFRSIPSRPLVTALAVSAALALGACSSDDDDDTPDTDTPTAVVPDTGDLDGDVSTAEQTVDVTLSTDEEVPPLIVPAPDATGTGTLTVGENGEASGSLTVSGLTGVATMAHIHRGFAGNAGPILIPLEPDANSTTFSVPAGSVLEGADLEAFRRGELYYNVHTDANPTGEVRGQIVPEGTTEFTVRVENVGGPDALNVTAEDGTTSVVPVPLSPGAFILFRDGTSPLLLPSDAANAGLEGVAEDGNPAAFAMGDDTVAGATIFNTTTEEAAPGPATPGLAYEFTFTAVPGDSVGFVTMFVQSNDWFYTPGGETNGVELFDEDGEAISGDVTDQVELYDSGTEEDETPGAGPNQTLATAPDQNVGPADDDTTVDSLTTRGETQPDLNRPVVEVTITPDS